MDKELELIRRAYLEKEEQRQSREPVAKILKKIGRTASELRRFLENDESVEIDPRDVIEIARGQLLEILRVEGVTVFGNQGEEVNLAQHNIVGTRDILTDKCTIVKVEQEGLEWDGELIRRAEVVVSKTANKTEG